jgi:uncharacterized membrane protein
VLYGVWFVFPRTFSRDSEEATQIFYFVFFDLLFFISLTLSMLMSYIYGAPSKARNLTSYIYMDEIFYWGF